LSKVNILIALTALMAVGLIATVGLIVAVYIPQINSQNSQIADQKQQLESQQNQIDNLNSSVDRLEGQVEDLQDTLARYSASIITALGVKDLVENDTNNHYLYIKGEVTNNGVTTAYNVGLHVVGYGASHEVLVDMVASADYAVYQNGFSSATNLSSILPSQSQTAIVSIYHSGTVVSWDITPVWTNTP